MHIISALIERMFTQRVIILSGMGFWCVAKQIDPRSGVIHLGHGFLRNTGASNNYWIKVSAAAIYSAYNLVIMAEEIAPSQNYARWHGFSIRCLANYP